MKRTKIQTQDYTPGLYIEDNCLWKLKFIRNNIINRGSMRTQKMWNASRFCVSSLRRGHANLLCIVPILEYVLPKQDIFNVAI